jgi:hypothetical protein
MPTTLTQSLGSIIADLLLLLLRLQTPSLLRRVSFSGAFE